MFAVIASSSLTGQDKRLEEVASLQEELTNLSAELYPGQSAEGQRLRQAWAELLGRKLEEANRRSSQAWHSLESRQDWEQFRQEKLGALCRALAIPKQPPQPHRIVVTGQLKGDGYCIQNLLYESRPGLWVSANLYLPENPKSRPAGLILVHSHHSPKWHHELQDMGIVWAKAGAFVLVPDLLGHGERRTHPFVDAKSFPEPFRVGRQDYYFRYNTAAQLYLLGETLMGWMVWDLRCGVGVLLNHAQADPQRIGIVGSVAGGGDVAAVTAAVDERIAAAVVFNFGGPEPEDVFPLPDDAEEKFNYAGSGSWESTRNLINSARDGFLPWVIVGMVAPRRLCYAHEFSWDRQRDPVWKRLKRIWSWYGAEDRLRSAHGRGRLTGRPPENTHCTHVGVVQRRAGVYQALHAWFGLAVPEQENTQHYTAQQLTCWTEQARRQLQPRPWPDWLADWQSVPKLGPAVSIRRMTAEELWDAWAKRHAKQSGKQLRANRVRHDRLSGARAEWWIVENLDGMPIPVVQLVPEQKQDGDKLVVIVVCSQGKKRFLQHHAKAIAQLLSKGVQICLVDVRGTGDTASEAHPSRTGPANSQAATALMLGESLEELRLLDLLAVRWWLADSSRTKSNNSIACRLAIWGENLAPLNDPATRIEVPWDARRLPVFADPSGPRLALQSAAFDQEVRAVYGAGELATYRSALNSPFLYLPVHAIRPGILAPGPNRLDTPDIIQQIAPRSVRLEALIDARNQPLDRSALRSWETDLHAFLRQRGHAHPQTWLELNTVRSRDESIAEWLIRQLQR